MTASRLWKVYYPLDGRTTAFVPPYRLIFNPVFPSELLTFQRRRTPEYSAFSRAALGSSCLDIELSGFLKGARGLEKPIASRVGCEYKIDSLRAGQKVPGPAAASPGNIPGQTGTEKAPYLL